MLKLVDPQLVGLPGLAAMAFGFALFFLSMGGARKRMAGGSADGESAARRSGASVLGILIQMLGFATVGFGMIRVGLRPSSFEAVAEGCAVAVLMGFAVLTFRAASSAMGRNWSFVARTRSDHELVTSGPFALVRHPIYLAMFAFMIALAIAFGHWRGLIPGVPIFWLGTAIRVAHEERLLRAEFGEAYDAYARRVKRFVPGLI